MEEVTNYIDRGY